MTKEELARTIFRVIKETISEKGQHVNNLTLDLSITKDLSLDSLDWAAIVVRLEGETGVDPFQRGVPKELRTLSDFVELYSSTLC